MGIKEEFEKEFPKGSLIHNPALEGTKWAMERCAVVSDGYLGCNVISEKIRNLSEELSDGK